MNWADIAVIIILVLSVLVAYKIGFVKAFFNFFSTIISLVLAYTLYPVVSKWLIGIGWLEKVKDSVKTTLNLQQAVNEMTKSAQTNFINNLELPKFLKSALLENNNSEVYNLFNVTQLEDYISSYLANICINVVAMIGTFLLVIIIVKALSEILDILSKLPVLSFANRTLGAVLGLAKGVIIIWLLCTIITFFYSNPSFSPIIEAINTSTIAKIFYNNNLLILMVTKIFT